jgi:hypothetical protein
MQDQDASRRGVPNEDLTRSRSQETRSYLNLSFLVDGLQLNAGAWR